MPLWQALGYSYREEKLLLMKEAPNRTTVGVGDLNRLGWVESGEKKEEQQL